MTLPDPVPGLVLNYSYLWAREAARGQEEGLKDRPCAILAVQEQNGRKYVFVAPITHSAPQSQNESILLTPSTKRRLGLDDDKSWLMCTEINRFEWPGVDLRAAPNNKDRSPVYGPLPAAVSHAAKELLQTINQKRQLKIVPRAGMGLK